MNKSSQLGYIDALRGLAIFAVVLTHCGQHGNDKIPQILQFIIGQGALGVQLFFFISAFTLMVSMHSKSNKQHYLFEFYLRRFFRIAPLYYLAIIYYLWQDGFGGRYWLGDIKFISFENIISNILFVHEFNPYWLNSVVPGGWSIAVEMLFYSFFPLLFLKITSTQRALIFAITTLVIRFFLDFILRKNHLISSNTIWDRYLFFYLPSQLPVFSLGILFYHIVKARYRIIISPETVLVLALCLILPVFGIVFFPEYIMFTIAILVLSISLSRFEFRIIVNGFFRYLGKISYGMYLTHFAVLYWLDRFKVIDNALSGIFGNSIENFIIRLIVVLITTIFIATILYRIIELPMQKFGYFFILNVENKLFGNKKNSINLDS